MVLFRRKKKAPPEPEFLNEAARDQMKVVLEQLGFGPDSIPWDEVEKEKERERRASGDDRSKGPGER